MKVILSKNAGFCPGVRRADTEINSIIPSSSDERVYTLGHLIHNRLYNEELEKRGVTAISFSDVESTFFVDPGKKMTVVIRTHGIPKDEEKQLKKLAAENEKFNLVDLTCPYVKRIHNIAENSTDESTVFLLFCDPNHPEAIGTLSHANGEKYPISSCLL